MKLSSKIHDLWSPGGTSSGDAASVTEGLPKGGWKGAACWRLQPVAGSWNSRGKSQSTVLWMLKDLSRVGAGFFLLRAGCLFLPSSCLLLKAPWTPCSSWLALSHPLFISTHLYFFFPSFFWGLWAAQRWLLPPSDFDFYTFLQCIFAMFMYIPGTTYQSVFVQCSLKPCFSWLIHICTIWGYYHTDLGDLEHRKCENALPTDSTSHSVTIFCHELSALGPLIGFRV